MGFFPKNKLNQNLFTIYDTNKIKKLLRRLLNKLGIFPNLYLFNKSWVKKLSTTDMVVIFDGAEINKVVNSILRKFPKKKILVWYWNPISRAALKPNQLDKRINSIWTYDPYDAKKYNLRLNTQFYFSELTSNDVNQLVEQDVFFVGEDKGREMALKKLERLFRENGITYYFRLTKYWASTKNSNSYSQPLPYPSVISIIMKSKVILDLVNGKEQEGISLRPLESLFFKKKLITNNAFIRKEKLYNPKNVFILGVDNLQDLSSFIDTDYFVSVDYDKLTKYYDFDNWATRFTV